MDRRAKLVGLAFLALSASAAQAFVTPSPPPGFGGTPGAWSFSPPSSTSQLNSILRGPGPSLAGGLPSSAAYRLAPGAARTLAGVVVGGSVAGALLLGAAWLASNCFEKQGGSWVQTCGNPLSYPQSDGYKYNTYYTAGNITYDTVGEACERSRVWYAGVSKPANATDVVTTIVSCLARTVSDNYGHVTLKTTYKINGTPGQGQNTYQLVTSGSACPTGWYVTPAGCVQTPPPVTVSPEEVVEKMAEKPLPNILPPGVPYPLDPAAPSIWNPTIGDPPVTQPLRVPQGNPVPIPNTNPQQYRQPITRWEHAPTTDEPWRMDTRPEDIISESPTGLTGPTSVTSGSPTGTPKEEQFDLCKEHPDIVACQKLGDLSPDPIKNTNVPLAINADGGFPSGGACPAPKVHTLLGRTFSFSVQPICDFATMIKPLLIGFAWLAAAMTFLGVARREN